MRFLFWRSQRDDVPRSLRGVYRNLVGAETLFSLHRGIETTFVTDSEIPVLRIVLAKNGVLTMEQLAPSLSLDAVTKEWVRKQ